MGLHHHRGGSPVASCGLGSRGICSGGRPALRCTCRGTRRPGRIIGGRPAGREGTRRFWSDLNVHLCPPRRLFFLSEPERGAEQRRRDMRKGEVDQRFLSVLAVPWNVGIQMDMIHQHSQDAHSKHASLARRDVKGEVGAQPPWAVHLLSFVPLLMSRLKRYLARKRPRREPDWRADPRPPPPQTTCSRTDMEAGRDSPPGP